MPAGTITPATKPTLSSTSLDGRGRHVVERVLTYVHTEIPAGMTIAQWAALSPGARRAAQWVGAARIGEAA